MTRSRIGPIVAAALCLALASAPRAGAPSTNPLFEVVTNASNPIFVADAGDGRLFVVERAGYIRIFASGALQPEDPNAFLDIHSVVNTAGEGGLTSMAFDPNFATNKTVYVMYTRTSPTVDVVLQSVVASYQVMETDPNRLDPATAKELLNLDAPIGPQFTNHKGGQIQIGPDGMLYIGFGDGGSGNDPNCVAQTRDLLFGKILRIDPHGTGHGVGGIGYGIPDGNPFANDPNNYAPEIWLMGLRNPWRYSFDRSTGDLWIGDVGQDTREEIDLLPHDASPGENYGWNVVEGLIARPGGNGNPIDTCPAYVKSMSDPNANYTAPIFDYDHSVGSSITGGYVYRGSVAEWRGRYIYADFISGDIRYLSKNGQTWQSTLVLDGDPFQPASFGEGSDGELYIAYLGQGWVYKLRFDRLGTSNGNSACVVKLNEGFAKLANTASKLNGACVAKAAKGKLGETDIQSCSANDPRLTKLGDKNRLTEGKSCGRVPAFGYTSASNGNIASYDSEIGLAHDVFGADLDLAIVLRAGDKATAVCQQAVLKGLAACQKTRRAEFVRCKKIGLKKETIQSVEQLAACLRSDPKGKIVKLCDATTGKLATRTIEKTCSAPGVDLSDAFPGCQTDDPDLLAQCLASAGCLRSCELFDSADGLDTDCAALCGN